MVLNTLPVGPGRPRFAFLHGLFGQGRNWATIARSLTHEGSSLLFDLPNHGRSAWTESFSYAQMADAVAAHLQRVAGPEGVIVVGHSMGGKTAMVLALRHPELVQGLAVVDIAPDDSSHGYGFAGLVAALRDLDLSGLELRSEADEALAPAIPDPSVRAFLLQNLRRSRRGFRWQCNLDLIGEALPTISGWPADVDGRYDGPVLWLRGGRSDYVRDEHIPAMRRMFPRARLNTIEGAGHWLHSENPDAVTEALRSFARSVRPARPVRVGALRGGPVGPDAFTRR